MKRCKTYITDEEQNESDVVFVSFEVEILLETVEFCTGIEMSTSQI